MTARPNLILPDESHPEPRSLLYSNRVTQYALDKIRIQGIPTFGYRTKRSIDEDIPWHYHPNRFEFHYLLQGSVSFVVQNQEYLMQEGDIFFTFPNERHRTGEQNVMRQLYWFTVEDTEDLLGLGKERSDWLRRALHSMKNRVIPVGGEMKDLFREVFLHLTSEEAGQQLYASLQMATALYKLVEYDRLLLERTVSPEIQSALNFIEVNAQRAISLEELAKHCHLSLSHFKLRFKKETGRTPAFYIQNQRIDRAKALLKSGRSITNVAYDLGFCSSDYFSTVFRRVTLMTPTEYLAKTKEETL